MTSEVTALLRARAERLGFTLFGVAPADPSEHLDNYRAWVAGELHGEMGYLARPDAVARRGDLDGSLSGVESVVVVGHEYGPGATGGGEDESDPTKAIVARYARGADYHDIVLEKLEELGASLPETVGHQVRWKAYVDTGPVLEREIARRAGLGWFGRNTMIINPERGSWFVLGALLVDQVLPPTSPFEEDRCGTCRACLDACPTGALLGRNEDGAPVLDARRCISYLTIELKGAIDPELRPLLGNRVFGCDICQEVCPWNERFGQARDGAPEYQPARGLDATSLVDFAERLLPMSEKGYQRDFADSPLARPRRRGMLRNLCVGIGNWLGSAARREGSGRGGDWSGEAPGPDEPGVGARADHPGFVGPDAAEFSRAIDVLCEALADRQPLVRSHAAWALGQSAAPEARVALDHRLEIEEDDAVRLELSDALRHIADSAGAGR